MAETATAEEVSCYQLAELYMPKVTILDFDLNVLMSSTQFH